MLLLTYDEEGHHLQVPAAEVLSPAGRVRHGVILLCTTIHLLNDRSAELPLVPVLTFIVSCLSSLDGSMYATD